MRSESKKLFYALCFLIVVSVFLTYYRSFVSEEYEIVTAEPTSFEGEEDEL